MRYLSSPPPHTPPHPPTPPPLQSVSGWFSLYLGSGIRGLGVGVIPAPSAPLALDTPLLLAIAPVNNLNPPGYALPAAQRFLLQQPPQNVTVTALRIGRMFNGPRLLATLAGSMMRGEGSSVPAHRLPATLAVAAPTVIIGSTAYVNVTLPSNVTQDWLNFHVTFQVRSRMGGNSMFDDEGGFIFLGAIGR